MAIGDLSEYDLSHLSATEKLEVEVEELKRRIADTDNLFNNFGLTSSEVVNKYNRLLNKYFDLKQSLFNLQKENEEKDKMIEDLNISLKSKDDEIAELTDQLKNKDVQTDTLLKEVESLKQSKHVKYSSDSSSDSESTKSSTESDDDNGDECETGINRS